MVSLTSRNTSRMFSVLMAVVKWWYRGFWVASRLLARKHSTMNAWMSGRLCSGPVCLVEEEDDGDVDEDAVVDNGLEDVERFAQSIAYQPSVRVRRRGTAAARSYLIVFRGGDEEEDGGDRVEALKPASSLRPLPAHVHHLEGNVLDFKAFCIPESAHRALMAGRYCRKMDDSSCPLAIMADRVSNAIRLSPCCWLSGSPHGMCSFSLASTNTRTPAEEIDLLILHFEVIELLQLPLTIPETRLETSCPLIPALLNRCGNSPILFQRLSGPSQRDGSNPPPGPDEPYVNGDVTFNNVAVNRASEVLSGVLVEVLAVDDPHLFEESRLAALASA
ncbi:hypothetical protein INR49_027274 [Caranx melampygus]|nr:hypothetical protein INR49_027274 [Caranx melampygus]